VTPAVTREGAGTFAFVRRARETRRHSYRFARAQEVPDVDVADLGAVDRRRDPRGGRAGGGADPMSGQWLELSNHAVERYRERVDPLADLDAAAAALRAMYASARRLRRNGSDRALYVVAWRGTEYRLAVREAPGRRPAILTVLFGDEPDPADGQVYTAEDVAAVEERARLAEQARRVEEKLRKAREQKAEQEAKKASAREAVRLANEERSRARDAAARELADRQRAEIAAAYERKFERILASDRRNNTLLVRAWKLLMRCEGEVGEALRAEIRAEVPGGFFDARQEQGGQPR
jgi:hypothetical protein